MESRHKWDAVLAEIIPGEDEQTKTLRIGDQRRRIWLSNLSKYLRLAMGQRGSAIVETEIHSQLESMATASPLPNTSQVIATLMSGLKASLPITSDRQLERLAWWVYLNAHPLIENAVSVTGNGESRRFEAKVRGRQAPEPT